MTEPYLIALKERLLAKTVILEDGCWYCSAGGEDSRYGTIWNINKTIGSHVASWMVHKGPIPEGLYVCHTCDYRRCVNPNHLFLGTHQDNITDMMNKGRKANRVGELNHMAFLTEEQVREIRKLLSEGYTQVLIAEQFNISQVTVSQINTGQRWAHVR